MATWAAAEAVPEFELVDRVLRGEDGAFADLMRRYNQRLYRLVRAIVRDDAEAEDVLQDAYVAAYRHLGGFERRASLATWLSRIALRAALKRRRAAGRLDLRSDLDATDAATAPASRAADPEQEAARAELRGRLEAAVDRLPMPYRVVVVLRDYEELSTEEVARSLRLSGVAVKVRLHRARALLRRELGAAIETARGRAFEFPAPRCRRLTARVCVRLGLGAYDGEGSAVAARRLSRAMASSTACTQGMASGCE